VDGLEVIGLRASVTGTEPLVRLRQARDVLVQGCRATAPVATLVAIEDLHKQEVAVMANDLRNVKEEIGITRGL